MTMALIKDSWASCEFTKRSRNKSFKGDGTKVDTPALAIELIKKGIANNRVEIKTGLSQTTISRYKSDIKQGLK